MESGVRPLLPFAGKTGMDFYSMNPETTLPEATLARRRAWSFGAAFVGAMLFLTAFAFAQDLSEEIPTDDTPDLVPQREGLTIEPYTGPPIFLPDPPPVIAAKEVKTTLHKEYFDPETKKNLRIERSVVQYSDDSIKNHGVYREFYESGQVFVEGHFDRGVPADDWKYFHENGSEAKSVSYEEGLLSGVVENRRADGTLKTRHEFARGKRMGTWETYDKTGELLLREEHYLDGTPDGLWQTWHTNGQKKQQTPFVNGHKHGTIIQWSEEGRKKAEVAFTKGKRHGKAHLWPADGRHLVQEYKEGKLVVTKVVAE